MTSHKETDKPGRGTEQSKTDGSRPDMDAETTTAVDISIVIVNYNVKEFVANLLGSLEKAAHGLKLQIFVVDNASSDGSAGYLKKRYPDVNYILNNDNIGFGRANNQAIRQARGKYTLLINPDTIVRQDTLTVMFRHLEDHPDTAAAGCKILNPDGTFAPESRRSVPTPMSALYKMVGLPRLFPNSSRFSAYYLGGTDENTAGPVPVLSGAFMFFRTDVLKELDGFDEQFFMYGEDIDLCYRVQKKGWKIDYQPATSIIHYKGESTKKENLDYVITFNKAMYQFFKKHYSFGYTFFFRIFILSGIVVKGLISYLNTIARKVFQPVVDLFVLNILIIVLFVWRYEIPIVSIAERFHLQFLSVNVLLSLLFLAAALYHELYGKNRYSIPAVIKSTGIAFAGVVLITFFLRDFAFSRLILLLSAMGGVIILSAMRMIKINRSRKAPGVPGSFLSRKVLLAGINDRTPELIRKLRSRPDWNYQLVGLVTREPNYHRDEVDNVPVIGDLSSVLKLVKYHKVDEIIFTLPAVDHDQILRTISELRETNVFPRIVADSLDYIVGKTNVEYLDDLPVIDADLSYFTRWNIFLKRLLDLTVSTPLILVMAPVFTLPAILRHHKKKSVEINISDTKKHTISLFLPYRESRWMNRFLLLWYVWIGRISLVGSPIIPDRVPHFANVKPGLCGLRQLSENQLYHEEEKVRYELYYLQNYSVWLDLDLILKTLIYRRPTLEPIDRNL
ncbi:glycosyltransferase [Balneolales bacterium ANBcel1]|nr:glycosyltransferase [Balneolales bacterium ANBcel1]